MGTGTLTDPTSNTIIPAQDVINIHNALEGNVVSRYPTAVAPAVKGEAADALYDLGEATHQWRNLYLSGNLVIAGQTIDFSSLGLANQNNRIASGRLRSTASGLNDFIRASGAGSFTILAGGSNPNLVCVIDGQSVTISSDIVVSSGITAAPSSNNTCDVDNTSVDGGSSNLSSDFTYFYGQRTISESADELGDMFREIIPVDAVGSEITALAGKLIALQAATEIFTCVYDTHTQTGLRDCRRGYFLDSSGNPIEKEALADNETLTLLNLGIVMLDQDGTTVDVTYFDIFYDYDEPTSPSTNQYWFDLSEGKYKRYNGSSFVEDDKLPIGMIVVDSSGNVIGSRSFDSLTSFSDDIYLGQFVVDNTNNYAYYEGQNQRVSVAGTTFAFEQTQGNFVSGLAASATKFGFAYGDTTKFPDGLSATEHYFIYVTYEGALRIEQGIENFPNFRPDLRGYYHSHNLWRCIGYFYTDATPDIDTTAYDIFTGSAAFPKIRVFRDSDVWYKPTGLHKIKATAIGGGGASSPTTANSGGTSSFGSIISATGGTGGTGNSTKSGGTGTGGDINILGGNGELMDKNNSSYAVSLAGGTIFSSNSNVRTTTATTSTEIGGGGVSSGSQTPGGGGGAAIKYLPANSVSDAETVTVGAGGAFTGSGGGGGDGAVIVEMYGKDFYV